MLARAHDLDINGERMKPKHWTAQDLLDKGYAEVAGKYGKTTAGGGVVGTRCKQMQPPLGNAAQQTTRTRAITAGSNPAPSPQTFFIPGPLPGRNEYSGKGSRWTYTRLKKDWTERIGLAILEAKLKPMQRVNIHFQWVERNTRRDKDNIRSADKFIQDALVAYGILADDGWDEIDCLSDTFTVDVSNPGVWVTLQEVQR